MRIPFLPLLICLVVSMVAGSDALASEVSVREVEDYVFGGYKGEFVCPPSADGNPSRAVIVQWEGKPWRFVFWHEASYCPFVELSDGSGVSFQFFEGNEGWAELFNQYGRMEKNSFVEVVDQGPDRAHVRWTYHGSNQHTGERAYRAVEDFYCLSNGLVLRRQSFESLMPDRHEGYTRETIEMIGMCPVGKLSKDVLVTNDKTGERHALAALDPFSKKRYDVYWKPREETLWQSTPRREGCSWREIDDAEGVVLVVPMRAGATFCAFGAASGYDASTTRVKDHSYQDTGGVGWVSSCWDHWPIGWANSQGHVVDAESLTKYPNHFSPAGNDMFALSNEEVERGDYWSLIGVVGNDPEVARDITRAWLDLGKEGVRDAAQVELLQAP